MWERTKDSIETEKNSVLFGRVVQIIKSKLDIKAISSNEAIWRQAHHSVLIDIESRHGLRDRLTISIDTSFEAESTLYRARLRDIREKISFEHDFSASLVRSTSRAQSNELWLRVIAESKTCVDEVHTV